MYSTAWHECLSRLVYVTTALILNVHCPSVLSLYSLFGKGISHCWHWVQQGSLRVPLPNRNCRTRSTSRATTKSITRTWAMINLNCKEISRKKGYLDGREHYYNHMTKNKTVKNSKIMSAHLSWNIYKSKLFVEFWWWTSKKSHNC